MPVVFWQSSTDPSLVQLTLKATTTTTAQVGAKIPSLSNLLCLPRQCNAAVGTTNDLPCNGVYLELTRIPFSHSEAELIKLWDWARLEADSTSNTRRFSNTLPTRRINNGYRRTDTCKESEVGCILSSPKICSTSLNQESIKICQV